MSPPVCGRRWHTCIQTDGEFIQNSYHHLFDYGIVELPYPEHTVISLLFLLKAELYLIKNSRQILKLSFSSACRTAAGPSNFQIGINTSHRFDINNSPISFIFQGQLEYVRYYHLDNLVNPLFDRGVGY